MWLALFGLALIATQSFSQDVGREFPSFSSFSKSEQTFEQLNLPKAILEPEKFAINEEARNFPKEAIEKGVIVESDQAESTRRRRRQTDEIEIADNPTEEVQISSRPSIESSPSDDAIAGKSNESAPSNKGGRNFPQEAVTRGIANFDERTQRRKRDSSQDVSNVPKVSNFPNFYKLSESDTILSEPNFPDTQSRISPLDVAFADPSLRNYPPPAVPSSAVQPLQGGQTRKRRDITSHRHLRKRHAGPNFPNFFQQSQSDTNIGALQFPDTSSRILSGFEFPDPEQRSFPSADSVLQGIQRRKRQGVSQQNFPNFFQQSQQQGLDFATPQFPNTQEQIGSGNEFNQGNRNIFGDNQRRKRGHKNNHSNLYDVTYFDYLDSLTAPRGQEPFFRPSRNAQSQGGGPRYPPFDPFGNTQYIPLPPSNPHFALPVTSEDPHMNSHFKERFRRPLRNANLRAFFSNEQNDFEEAENNFYFESSPEFNEINIMSQLRKLHFR